LKPVIEIGAVVVTRLRKDAVLYAEPKPPRKRKRGRPSHVDKCAALRRAVLKQTFFRCSGKSHEINNIHKQFYKLLKLVA
jgi:hypothetical protein